MHHPACGYNGFSDLMVRTYNPEDHERHIHCHENLKPHKSSYILVRTVTAIEKQMVGFKSSKWIYEYFKECHHLQI